MYLHLRHFLNVKNFHQYHVYSSVILCQISTYFYVTYITIKQMNTEIQQLCEEMK